ncbi:MAG: F0F1 ATP synthase subunit B, partial [Bacteroidales bacterium]|nr:F0F1 ATP synthase subunit B [Bacteroidales bacterium]
EEARKEQSAIMKEATEAKKALVEQTKVEAREEADKILADARIRIAAEKESALRDVRREVALLSVSIAEKILRKDLSSEEAGAEFISKMIDEAAKTSDKLS